MVALFSYIRIFEKNSKKVIPSEIKKLMTKYIKAYIIFGSGMNKFSQFGDFKQLENTKWKQLYQLESLLNDYNDVYFNSESILVKTSSNSLYVAGSNINNYLGIDTNEINIKSFTKIPFNEDINIISKGMCAEFHSFLLTKDNKLYVSGKNNYGCFGDGIDDKYHSTAIFKQIDINWLSLNVCYIFICNLLIF